MRCPYCGGFNSERASFCVYCGRDLTSGKQPAQRQQPQPPQQPPSQQPRPAPPPQSYPTRPTPATQQPGQVPAAQRRRAPAMPQQIPVPAAPPAPPAPEAPAPFPPHTVAQLQALEQGALAYTVTDTTTNGQRKKIVRIIYPRCVAWQQVATLLKALKEQQDSRFETIIIQGYLSPDPDVYTFTNGQLTFDRNVRLGSQTLNRYQIETGNGFESDSVRIVLSE
ncbi:MAG TPA: hypothetical protein VEL49_10370 [Ktedonobacteraceae bacterium]|nr:hypothetical protein [Ktedonobacteraceae bacterium]